MGRLPGQNAVKKEEDGFLSIGEEEMLTALKSTLKDVEDKYILTDEYSFMFTTAKVNKQAGSLKRTPGRRLSNEMQLSFEMFIEVKTTFEAVENGSLKEEGYYFELTTPYFHLTSGHYPPHDKDESTRNDDGKEPVAVSPGNYFPCPVLDICKKTLSVIKKLLEVGSLRPPGSIKEIDGQINSLGVTIIIRLVLIASALMVHAEALPITKEEQPLTLTAGTNGIVPFECSNEHQSASKYYTVWFEGKDRPFYINGILDPEGLMSTDQAERFSVEYVERDDSVVIEISIASVSVEDGGTYVVMFTVQGESPEYHLIKRDVKITVPPGPAECFLMKSESYKDYYLIRCHFKPGNGNSTVTCFQNNEKLRYLQYTVNANHVMQRRIFWLMNIDIPVFCCAHDVNEIKTVTQDSCNQYRYPRTEPFNNHVSPGHNAPAETAHTTKPLLLEEESQQPIIETTPFSGCIRNCARPTTLLLMTVMIYACLSNP